MANQVAYYFYAPTWDFPPDGPIKIGSVIASVKTPELPLYTATPPAEGDMFSTDKRVVEFSREKLQEGKLSIFTRFLSVLGVGIDMSAGKSSSDEETFVFDRIETTQFFPTDDYVNNCINAAPVRRYLDKSRYRKPIYIITGLKLVSGAKAKSRKAYTSSGCVGVDISGTLLSAAMVPIDGGPEIGGSRERSTGMSWKESSDFVLAFRVRKVVVHHEGRVKRNKDYTTGAMLSSTVEEVDDIPAALSITTENVDFSEEGYALEEVMEGDEIVTCGYRND